MIQELKKAANLDLNWLLSLTFIDQNSHSFQSTYGEINPNFRAQSKDEISNQTLGRTPSYKKIPAYNCTLHWN